jgi:hypothetical protein
MAERGAVPNVPKVRQRALHAVRSLFSPLLPDDYLELINPLWSTQELRGRIERIERETPDAVTVLIRPGYKWAGHQPGQYLRIGVVVDGVHHWRAYSLTTSPGRAWCTRKGETFPASTSFGVIPISPSGRPGSVVNE